MNSVQGGLKIMEEILKYLETVIEIDKREKSDIK